MDKNKQNSNFFNQNPVLVFAVFAIIAIVIFKYFSGDLEGGNFAGSQSARTKQISYYEFKELVKKGSILKAKISDETIKALDANMKYEYVIKRIVPDENFLPLLEKHKIEYAGFSEENVMGNMLFGWFFPAIMIFGIWMFLSSRVQKSMGSGILGIGSSKKLVNSEKPKTRFEDVAGNEEAKEEVKEIIDFLRHPDRYVRLGAKIPKGILLVGPPGTGKTLLAKAVAGEASVPFFSVSASSFMEMFVGVGAARVRDLFEQAKKEAPSIIFMDELDALGKNRSSSSFGGHDEREQTLNQLLAEMDGFGSTEPVIILAATNRPEVLDPALLRPGRFDRQVLVDKPDYKGRLDILKVHVKGVKVANNIDLEEIATMTAGLAGADLANIVNEASLLAGRKNKEFVEQENLKEAVERSIAGLEKKSRRISDKEKKIVAFHESGHAVIAQITKGAKKVNKVSIIPRGLAALGYTLNTPEENRYLMQRHELVAEIDVLLGGRAAEEVFLEEISTGASNDLQKATDIVKSMVMIFGMSDVAGLMVMEKQNSKFLGGGFSQTKDYSEKLSQDLDEFVIKFLNDRYETVKDKLKKYKFAVEKIVKKLEKTEVISGESVSEILIDFENENGIKSQWYEEIKEKLKNKENKTTQEEDKKNENN